jgi:hypothetical protein
MFQQFCKKIGKELYIADGRRFEFGRSTVRFSTPVVHGEEESGLGWVLMCIVEHDGEKMIHAPDVQGPVSNETLQMIVAERPDVLILGGPPLYLVDSKVTRSTFDRGMSHVKELAKTIPTIVLEHHLLRAAEWRDESTNALEEAKSPNNRILTAAEYVGEENKILEASRRELYEHHPPSKAFMSWTKLPREKRRKKSPPLR